MAGITAGAVTTLCLHPLDLIKTRFQGEFNLVSFLFSYLKLCLIAISF